MIGPYSSRCLIFAAHERVCSPLGRASGTLVFLVFSLGKSKKSWQASGTSRSTDYNKDLWEFQAQAIITAVVLERHGQQSFPDEKK